MSLRTPQDVCPGPWLHHHTPSLLLYHTADGEPETVATLTPGSVLRLFHSNVHVKTISGCFTVKDVYEENSEA